MNFDIEVSVGSEMKQIAWKSINRKTKGCCEKWAWSFLLVKKDWACVGTKNIEISFARVVGEVVCKVIEVSEIK